MSRADGARDPRCLSPLTRVRKRWLANDSKGRAKVGAEPPHALPTERIMTGTIELGLNLVCMRLL
jgi:hypothetical protein